jgi:hypothetical protein
MGTRGTVSFVADNDLKTIFNQWDSYPSGLGLDVLHFIRMSKRYTRKLPKQISDLKNVPEYQVDKVSTEGWEAQLDDGHYIDSTNFPIYDSLFCEWSYVIDADTRTFEVYKGFQDEPHNDGRFAKIFNLQSAKVERSGRKIWYPVRLIQSWSFDDLPSDKEFLAWDEKRARIEDEKYATNT